MQPMAVKATQESTIPSNWLSAEAMFERMYAKGTEIRGTARPVTRERRKQIRFSLEIDANGYDYFSVTDLAYYHPIIRQAAYRSFRTD
jgi:hypothetical protein